MKKLFSRMEGHLDAQEAQREVMKVYIRSCRERLSKALPTINFILLVPPKLAGILISL